MKEVALYIHIPFCKQKCFYCDFPSYARKDDLMSDYIEALLIELKEKIKEYKSLAFRKHLNNDEKARRAELRIELKNASNDLAKELKAEFNEIEEARKKQ